ncbi:acyl-coenzyme A amino acid N-acyltransferase 1-like [Haliotis asinina]|uniref:acyl-coenzyme A amino acid N-acyltransferase 1-like n=1 Tax=Haliotis asinina TaxID=109174 RepID=UPI003531FBCF
MFALRDKRYIKAISGLVASHSQRYSSMVFVNISPRVALVDEKVSITVSGLRPQQPVTVKVWVEEGKAVFSSCGHFLANQQGQVNAAQHASLGGTYRGVDRMGLIWSMKPVPGISKNPLLRKRDVTTPLVLKLSVIDGHVPLDDLHVDSTVVLATDELERWYKHRTVRRIVVREGSLRGALFFPAGEGPFPGVVDMIGITGGLAEFRAALMASRGFVCFALAYLGYDDLPTAVTDIDFDYFLNAVNWLASHPDVQPGGIGVVGNCKGGELAFLLGMSTDKVKVLVNLSGIPMYSLADLQKSGQCFWKGFKLNERKIIPGDEGVTLKNSFSYDNEIIPAWANNAKILYLCGENDDVWRTDFAHTFVETCPEEKRKNIELIIYPGAGHEIEPPYTPLMTSFVSKTLGMTIAMGGQPEAHAAAQEDAWKRLLHFLHKHLPQKHHTTSRL